MQPEFKPKVETVHSVHNGKKIETLTFFHCSACGAQAAVEEDLGLCRPCWRLVVMIGEIARELRGEVTPGRTPRRGSPARHRQDSPVVDAPQESPAPPAKVPARS